MDEFKGTRGEWKVKHSESKTAYNIIGTSLGGKYKIARCPYIKDDNLPEKINNNEINEAKANAQLISACPDLLNACQAFMGLFRESDMRPEDESYELADIIQNAINKALGINQ